MFHRCKKCSDIFFQILKRRLISWITSQNVQTLQIFATSASFLWGNLKKICLKFEEIFILQNNGVELQDKTYKSADLKQTRVILTLNMPNYNKMFWTNTFWQWKNSGNLWKKYASHHNLKCFSSFIPLFDSHIIHIPESRNNRLTSIKLKWTRKLFCVFFVAWKGSLPPTLAEEVIKWQTTDYGQNKMPMSPLCMLHRWAQKGEGAISKILF